MNYTKEELEEQVEGCLRTCRRMAENYKALESAFLQAMQQYHAMVNLYNGTKHITPSWRDCSEESCREASRMLSILSGGGDSIKLNRLEEKLSKF